MHLARICGKKLFSEKFAAYRAAAGSRRGAGAVSINVGLAGTGRAARKHTKALSRVEQARVVACMDADPDSAAEAAVRFPGAGAYSNLQDMLAEHELDAVFVCVRPDAHGELELALIEEGIPFLVENPLGDDAETPERILEALQEAELWAAAGYRLRYGDTVARARQHLEEHPALLARGCWIGSPSGTPNTGEKQSCRGSILEQSSHLIDLARCLFGEVKSVFCAGRTQPGREHGATISACTLTFESGLVCQISSSTAGQGDVALEARCRNSSVRLAGANSRCRISTEHAVHEFTGTEDLFLAQARAFLRAVEGEDSDLKSSYGDAVRTHRVCCAVLDSMRKGQPVEL